MDLRLTFEIGNGARDAQDAGEAAHRELQSLGGFGEQRAPIWIGLRHVRLLIGPRLDCDREDTPTKNLRPGLVLHNYHTMLGAL